jgi:hypothetical protein
MLFHTGILIVGGAYAVIFTFTEIIKRLVVIMLGRKYLNSDSDPRELTVTAPPKKGIWRAAESSLIVDDDELKMLLLN